MLNNLIILLIGLMLGWFFLPAPAWATKLYDWLIEKVPGLSFFVRKK